MSSSDSFIIIDGVRYYHEREMDALKGEITARQMVLEELGDMIQMPSDKQIEATTARIETTASMIEKMLDTTKLQFDTAMDFIEKSMGTLMEYKQTLDTVIKGKRKRDEKIEPEKIQRTSDSK